MQSTKYSGNKVHFITQRFGNIIIYYYLYINKIGNKL